MSSSRGTALRAWGSYTRGTRLTTIYLRSKMGRAGRCSGCGAFLMDRIEGRMAGARSAMSRSSSPSRANACACGIFMENRRATQCLVITSVWSHAIHRSARRHQNNDDASRASVSSSLVIAGLCRGLRTQYILNQCLERRSPRDSPSPVTAPPSHLYSHFGKREQIRGTFSSIEFAGSG